LPYKFVVGQYQQSLISRLDKSVGGSFGGDLPHRYLQDRVALSGAVIRDSYSILPCQ